jgi:hypothetical protein
VVTNTLQVIYGHGEPWWNDIDRGKPQIHQPGCSLEILKQNHLITNQEDLGEGNFVYKIVLSYS